MKLDPHDPDYPRPLCHLDQPPPLIVSGPLAKGRVVAIAGSRDATDQTLNFVHQLAYHLAKAGVIVVSGGAVGVDRMAHEAAMKAGITWCVACTGHGEVYPPENDDLFTRIQSSSSSRMIWPFPDGTPKDRHTPRKRNGVLVGLAEAVIIAQAVLKSGSRNTVSWARQLGRKLFIVPSHPLDTSFTGSFVECLRGGVNVLWSIPHLFQSLQLPAPNLEDPAATSDPKHIRAPNLRAQPQRQRRPQTYSEAPLFAVDPDTWTEDEKLVFSRLSMAPIQQDTIIDLVGLSTSSTLTALLTLSLKDVVVEGPDGFFRRRIAL